MRLDHHEHQRRATEGIGALTSTGLLHGLWLLPSRLPVPIAEIPDVKLERLRSTPGCVIECNQSLIRIYSPPGVVERLTFEGSSIRGLLRRAIKAAPVFERNIIVRCARQPAIDSRTLAEATEWGVGISIAVGEEIETIVLPSRPSLGVPSVYRWWVAELAYEGVLYENTQLLS
jgi:hypothetical protein